MYLKKGFKILSLILASIIIFYFFYYSLFQEKKLNPKVMIGSQMPNLQSKTLYKNKVLSLSNIVSNEKFVVNIFASWCVPCKIEHPILIQLKNSKIKIIGINYKDNQKNAKAFIEKYQNPFEKVLIDSDGALSIQLGAFGVPETFLVDKNFTIIAKHIGPIDNNFVKKVINLK
ncbi:thiol-disulfide isomerase-like thioredoxin [alpha proteobacterium HIMB114]|nr:thiol-disulfide isomerase-like thioredoxin [alpha proteobacterium HIMB114]